MNVTKRENSFRSLYGEFCKIDNCPVLYRVNVHVHMGVLDFYGDGLTKNDWRPILKALSFDRYLQFVGIRSKASYRQIIPWNGLRKLSSYENLNVIPRSILAKVTLTLSDYLTVNSNLTGLDLDGLHFTMANLTALSKGLSKSPSLQSLSLRRCVIGDGGCQIICSALRDHRTITSIDFSACELSENGALVVSQLLQHHNLKRCNEKWLQSLRYRTPNPEKMPGLLRVTLSHNNIGDQGAQHILQVLHDDCWLKAIDMQNCYLTEETGRRILELFELNDSISILDVRNNNMMSPSTITAIISQLTSRQSQFDWSPDGPTCPPKTASETTLSLTGLRKASGLRKTRSNVFPSGSKALKDPRKCSSTPNMNATTACTKVIPKRALSSQGETSSQAEILQNHLEYLRQQLEEEVAKRKEAEETRDKAQNRLESHLKELAETEAAISGRVLVDKDVIQQVNSAFSDVNQLLAMMGGTNEDQCLNLSEYSSYQESSNTKSSFSTDMKCYNDEPTSTNGSDGKTTDFTPDDIRRCPSTKGEGNCLPIDDVDNLSKRLKNIGGPEEDSSTLRNSCTDEESKTSKSFSDESDPSWTTMASRSTAQTVN